MLHGGRLTRRQATLQASQNAGNNRRHGSLGGTPAAHATLAAGQPVPCPHHPPRCSLLLAVLITEDASEDARFAANPYVAGAPFIKFYAGAPLVGRSESGLGWTGGQLGSIDWQLA